MCLHVLRPSSEFCRDEQKMDYTIIFHFMSRLQEKKKTYNPLGIRQEAWNCESSTENASEEDGEITVWTFSCSLEGQQQLQTDV